MLKFVFIENFELLSPAFAKPFSVICNYMRKTALTLGIFTSVLSFSQNKTEVVDVVVNGKIETQEDKEAQNYTANYLTNFFENTYEKANGFYLVVEQKTKNNRNSLKIDDLPFISSKDIKNITIKSNGNKYPTVIFELNKKGNKKLTEISSNNIGNGIALIIDKKIITMPMITEKMFEGKIEYNSNLNFGETEKLTKKLK